MDIELVKNVAAENKAERESWKKARKIEAENAKVIQAGGPVFFKQIGDELRAAVERMNEACQSDNAELTIAFRQDEASISISRDEFPSGYADLKLDPSGRSVTFRLSSREKPETTGSWEFVLSSWDRVILSAPNGGKIARLFCDPEEVCNYVLKSAFAGRTMA